MALQSLLINPFDNIEFSILRKIRDEKKDCYEKVLRKLTKEHIRKGEAPCTLAQVRDELIRKGVNAGKCKYTKNDFAERLEVNLANTDFSLSIQLFPKRDPKKSICMSVCKGELQKNLNSDTTPESAADFILGLSEWMPEYHAIEVRIQEEEMKSRTVHALAMDILKRNIGAILNEKGYSYSVSGSHFMNNATIKITFSDILTMTLEVDLNDEFLDQTKKAVESLPAQTLHI